MKKFIAILITVTIIIAMPNIFEYLSSPDNIFNKISSFLSLYSDKDGQCDIPPNFADEWESLPWKEYNNGFSGFTIRYPTAVFSPCIVTGGPDQEQGSGQSMESTPWRQVTIFESGIVATSASTSISTGDRDGTGTSSSNVKSVKADTKSFNVAIYDQDTDLYSALSKYVSSKALNSAFSCTKIACFNQKQKVIIQKTFAALSNSKNKYKTYFIDSMNTKTGQTIVLVPHLSRQIQSGQSTQSTQTIQTIQPTQIAKNTQISKQKAKEKVLHIEINYISDKKQSILEEKNQKAIVEKMLETLYID